MEERRKLQRKYLAFFTRVFDEVNGELMGHLADITVEGMSIISVKPIETAREFKFVMDLPENVFNKNRIVINARSIWSQPDVDPTFLITGFQLIDVSPEMINIIEHIIQEYRIRE